jgi:nucleoside 2-deoxyribosyltransferase
MPRKRIIYLACPYTDPDRMVREQRFRFATEAAAALIERGHIVFSPITMTHPIDTVLAGNAATLGSEFWVTFDEAFMDVCSEMIILDIEGWDRSSGIRREIEYFERQGKPVRFISPGSHLLRNARADAEV